MEGALAVASSGIASTLLLGGKTGHTMFKIPLQLNCSKVQYVIFLEILISFRLVRLQSNCMG